MLLMAPEPKEILPVMFKALISIGYCGEDSVLYLDIFHVLCLILRCQRASPPTSCMTHPLNNNSFDYVYTLVSRKYKEVL